MEANTDKIVAKIEKLLRLSEGNANEAESTAAMNKAQELLAAYNLDMTAIEQASGKSEEKRSDEATAAGAHKYQRTLWQRIADLNFCWYWTIQRTVPKGSKTERRYEHRLVGRKANVITTKNMAIYLNGAIDRLCRAAINGDNSKFYSSWAVAYREGVADRVIDKIRDRRRAMIAEEKAKEAARPKSNGNGTSLVVTLRDVQDREFVANYDFLYGEGAYARSMARSAEAAEKRKAAEAAAEAAYAAWAAANPKEAAKAEKKAKAREERAGRSYSWRETAADRRRSTDAYRAGYKDGAGVSIDPQVDRSSTKQIS